MSEFFPPVIVVCMWELPLDDDSLHSSPLKFTLALGFFLPTLLHEGKGGGVGGLFLRLGGG